MEDDANQTAAAMDNHAPTPSLAPEETDIASDGEAPINLSDELVGLMHTVDESSARSVLAEAFRDQNAAPLADIMLPPGAGIPSGPVISAPPQRTLDACIERLTQLRMLLQRHGNLLSNTERAAIDRYASSYANAIDGVPSTASEAEAATTNAFRTAVLRLNAAEGMRLATAASKDAAEKGALLDRYRQDVAIARAGHAIALDCADRLYRAMLTLITSDPRYQIATYIPTLAKVKNDAIAKRYPKLADLAFASVADLVALRDGNGWSYGIDVGALGKIRRHFEAQKLVCLLHDDSQIASVLSVHHIRATLETSYAWRLPLAYSKGKVRVLKRRVDTDLELAVVDASPESTR